MIPAILLSLLSGGAPAAETAWTPTAEEAVVVERLTARHLESDCATLQAALPEGTTSLARIADHVALPPWVGVRAARCVVQTEDGVDHAVRWSADPARRNYARLVVAALPDLSATSTARVRAALAEGPHAALLPEPRVATP